MKNKSIFNFELKVIILLVIIFAIVLSIGLISFFRFSNLLDNIQQNIKKDNRLILVHSLKNDLTELSNLANTSNLIDQDDFQNIYNDLKIVVKKKLDKFFTYFNEDEQNKWKSLDSLINDKIIVLDGIIFSEDPFRVQKALGKVVINIDNNEFQEEWIAQEEIKKSKYDFQPSTKIKEELDYDLIKKSKNQLKSISKEEEKLLKKLKKAQKKNKLEKVSELDSLIQERKNEAYAIHDKLTQKEEIVKNLENEKIEAINKIYQGIKDVSFEESIIEKLIKSNQLKLISKDHFLSVKIAGYFNEYELLENKKIAEATKFAEIENEKTKLYFYWFCFFVALLLVLIAYIVFQYVKKNNLYKAALKKSTIETEKLIQTRERILATISHELRTPIHAIAGFAELLLNEQLTKHQKEYINIIQSSSKHLNFLINDVLDYSKLKNDKLKLDAIQFNIAELFSEIGAIAKQLSASKNIEVIIENADANTYLSDPYRLKQILLNLISNAVKFTEQGSIVIRVFVLKELENENLIQIEVEDTGLGMEKEDLKKIFDEFEQVHNHSKSVGTGLGLSITKKIVELFDGEIFYQSEKGKGTKATLKLKLTKSKIVELDNNKIINETNVNVKLNSVLIVDDEDFNRKLLKSYFVDSGVIIYEASNGQKALELLEKHQVDLILMDFWMPLMNGEETTLKIRELEKDSFKNSIILLLTASGKEMEVFSKYFDGFVPKPFSKDVLQNEINKFFTIDLVNVDFEVSTSESEDILVDFDRLINISAGDMKFYEEMLSTFVHSTENAYEVMKLALKNNNFDEIANQAHKIASPCKFLQIESLYNLLKNIEKVSKYKDESSINQYFVEFEREVLLVLNAVKRELSLLKNND